MRKNILSIIGLVIVSTIAILVDCYTGYMLFLMTVTPIMQDLSSTALFIFLFLVMPILFITSIIGLFRLKQWAYRTFFAMTIVLHSLYI